MSKRIKDMNAEEYKDHMAMLDHIVRTGSLCSPTRNNKITGSNADVPMEELTEEQRQEYMRQLFGDTSKYVSVGG